jgi:hypothetical protein
MQLIASATVGAGGAATMDFNSIPQTFTDLTILMSARCATGSETTLTFNANATGYTRRLVYGDGSTVLSASGAGNFYAFVGAATSTALTFGNTQMIIPNYTGSANKVLMSDTVNENNATTASQAIYAGLWSNTAAITSISLAPFSGLFAQFSTAYLYGTLKGSGGATVT